MTLSEAIERSREVLAREASKLSSVTYKLRSYLDDLDSAFVVFHTQELHLKAATEEERRMYEK